MKALNFGFYMKFKYVTVFWKTDLEDTNIKIHFLPVDKSHIPHALSRETKHLRLDGWICFYRWLFYKTLKPRGCISWPVWPLRGINMTAWGAKLILTTDLAFPVSCASMGYLLMVQHCPMFALARLSPPPIDSIRDIGVAIGRAKGAIAPPLLKSKGLSLPLL